MNSSILHHIHPFVVLGSKRKHHLPQIPPPTNQTLPDPKKSKNLGEVTKPIPILSPEGRGKQKEEQRLLDDLINEICENPAFNYNDNALSNITGESHGDF